MCLSHDPILEYKIAGIKPAQLKVFFHDGEQHAKMFTCK